jgi:hypothetical protein
MHELWDVPKRLNLVHAAILKAPELVEPHMGEVPRGRNAQPRLSKRAHIVAHGANPRRAFVRLASDKDCITALEIRQGRHQAG